MTIYALSTGPSVSGIAIIRVSGDLTKKVIKLLLIYFVLCVLQMALDIFIFKSTCFSIYSAFVPLSILISFVFMYSKKVWILDSLYLLFVLSIFLFTYLV